MFNYAECNAFEFENTGKCHSRMGLQSRPNFWLRTARTEAAIGERGMSIP